MSDIFSFVVAILVFCLIITVHEFGHFITAKLFKVQVNEFSIGMGPKIVSWGKGETKYSLRILPIGGFCAMEGEDGGEFGENPRAFNRKPKWQRCIILVAGAVCNIILGFFLMFFVSVTSELIGTTTVNYFQDYAVSNASVDGGDYLMPGDIIRKIDNTRTHVMMDVSFALMTDEDGIVDITVVRDGKEIKLNDVTFNMTDDDGTKYTTIDFVFVGVDNTLYHIFDKQDATVIEHIGNCFVSFGRVIKDTWYSVIATVRQIWISLIDMVSGRYSLKDLSGPVGTTTVITEAVNLGVEQLLLMAMFITVNLGVFNLLPFPALDGGRVVLLGLEAVRKKPLSPKVEAGINFAGLALLMGLVVIVTVSDIIKLF